jgi:hypothetical protein
MAVRAELSIHSATLVERPVKESIELCQRARPRGSVEEGKQVTLASPCLPLSPVHYCLFDFFRRFSIRC